MGWHIQRAESVGSTTREDKRQDLNSVTLIIAMNGLNVFCVKIIADSRGAWLMNELAAYNDTEIVFSVKYRKGAGLAQLWEYVEFELLHGNSDMVFILGSVCDLTDKYGNTRTGRVYWPPHNIKARFEAVKATLSGMENNYHLLKPRSMLCFLPESGLDLIRYNKVFHPVPFQLLIMQEEFEDCLRDLQQYTIETNKRMGSITPWTLEVTNVNRGGRMVPVFDRTYDGLHYSQAQLKKLAFTLWKYVQVELLGRKMNRHRPLWE